MLTDFTLNASDDDTQPQRCFIYIYFYVFIFVFHVILLNANSTSVAHFRTEYCAGLQVHKPTSYELIPRVYILALFCLKVSSEKKDTYF